MIIQNSNIEMTSTRSYTEKHSKFERLSLWIGAPADSNIGEALPNTLIPEDSLDISAEAKKAGRNKIRLELSPHEEAKLNALCSLIESFTGKKVRVYIPVNSDDRWQQQMREMQNIARQLQPQARSGWGISYDYVETRHEAESTSFSAAGVVKTADGKEIDISVQLNMSRSFTSHREIHFQAGNAQLMDPLVINFRGTAADLTERNFEFDLDTDGKKDTISFVKPGSGFLALDLNQDGIINNGSELFGPQSGNGFTELAAYDEDGNGWIDENDSVYQKLRIWTKDENGNDVLFALADKDIGAIYLNHIDTSFSIKNASNELNGQVKSSSIFLKENGTAGTVQQLDLVI